MDAIITLQGLTRYYGEHLAVDNVTLAVRRSEVFGLLGPNGAGKTTTIRMLTTLLPPTSGTATVAGFDVRRQGRAVRRVIGSVPQAVSVEGGLTARENLLIFAKLYGVPGGEREGRINEMLATLGLSERAGDLVRTFSGGLVRRLELGQALLHRPAVLFLDEPTVGLDPVARRAFWQHLGEMRQRFGLTVLITTHYMEEAAAYCGRLAIMDRGRIMALGSLPELAQAANRPGASLEDLFAHFTGKQEREEGGDFRDVGRIRRTARRLG